ASSGTASKSALSSGRTSESGKAVPTMRSFRPSASISSAGCWWMVTTRDGGRSYVVRTPQLSTVTGKPFGAGALALAPPAAPPPDAPQPAVSSTADRATATARTRDGRSDRDAMDGRGDRRVRAGVNKGDT